MRAATVIFIFILVMFGCSSDPEKPAPEKPEAVAEPTPKASPTTAKIHMIVSEQVNPDIDERPSPIMIRIYELKSLGKFEEADFYKLFENYDSQLGPELIASEQYNLKPGEMSVIEREFSADTRYIGVAGAFRDINQAIWKDTIELKDEKTIDLLIFIEKLNISVWKK